MARIALAGNPNTGKTTLFNALSGARARVGNYSGVTVERREAEVRPRLGRGAKLTLIDLPGCYSLTARSQEEDVAQRVLLGELGDGPCDAVVCVVDATQLRRGLYLLFQLCELGLPVIVAMTMVDSAAQRGIQIDTAQLEEALGLRVVSIHAASHTGLQDLVGAMSSPTQPTKPLYLPLDEHETQTVLAVEEALKKAQSPQVPNLRGLALWLLTSRLQTLGLGLPALVREAVIHGQNALALDPAKAFNRKVIEARFGAVDRLVHAIELHPGQQDVKSARLDGLLLHPVWGTLCFLTVMGLLFQGVFSWAQPVMAAAQDSVAMAAHQLEGWLPASQLRSLLVHGVLTGIGNVIAFVPQIFLLFVGLALLESSGYMARAAVLADRLMRRVGLHGRAFIPLLSSFACAIPGIMAARTLDSRRDRLVTMLMAPLMSCSARLPVYTLVAAATLGSRAPVLGFLSPGGLAIFGMYVLGFVAALLTGRLLRGTFLRGEAPPLVFDLPPYRRPGVRDSLQRATERSWAFVAGAGPTLVLLSVILWALMSYPHIPAAADTSQPAGAPMARQSDVTNPVPLPASQPVHSTDEKTTRSDDTAHVALRSQQLEHSFAGRLGHAIEPIIKPLGFDWRIGIGLLASVAAREVLVGTLAQVYALDASGDTEVAWPTLRDALAGQGAHTDAAMSPLAGLSLMVFFALALQCMSTVAILRRESGGWRWPLAALIYMNALAWLVSFVVYQGGSYLGWGTS